LKRIWYHIVKVYIRTGLFFFFKKIKIVGTENIPKKGAILFVSNHKNALVDPLLIATSTTRNIHFLTRASAFKLRLVKWILSTVNMLPIYRLRDGKKTLAKNNEIFSKCYNILNKKRSLLIFPEGTHDIRRWVRPLSKGFTRITFGALEQYPNLDLTIIPVGLNYSQADSAQKLKAVVHEKMTEVTTHVSEIDNYDTILEQLGNVDYLNPTTVNKKLANLVDIESLPKETNSKEPSFLWRLLKTIVSINSFLPLLIYKVVEPKIQEIEFVGTTKLAVGITAFPLFYVIQAVIINYFFGIKIAIPYLMLSSIFIYILVKTRAPMEPK